MTEILIELQSELCVSSGNNNGNTIDNDICFDNAGFPIIPGRRIKGCLHQAADMLVGFGAIDKSDVDRLFGTSYDEEGALSIGNARVEHAKEMTDYLKLPVSGALRKYSMPSNISDMYSYVKGQTAIEDGVAKDHSTRFTRVLNPYDPVFNGRLRFSVPVELTDSTLKDTLDKCCNAVRHIGLMRNRGLGWVKMTLNYDAPNKDRDMSLTVGTDDCLCTVSYRIRLDSNLLLPGCAEQLTAVPGRTVIGCLASRYIKRNLSHGEDPGKDTTFCDLFLNGKTMWSDLNPVVGDVRTEPTPLMVAYLKNKGEYINRYETKCKGEKQKTLDGTWIADTCDGFMLAETDSETISHHSHKNDPESEMLYSVSSIKSDMIYEGNVTLPSKYKDIAFKLLEGASLRLGGSKSAQYSQCSVIDVKTPTPVETSYTDVKANEPVFIVLTSDMLLVKDGQAVSDNGDIREILANTDELKGKVAATNPPLYIDYVKYHTISGYNAMWHLQKMHQTVISGGSVFCLTASCDAKLMAAFRLGEYRQEGMGSIKVLSLSDMQRIKNIKKGKVNESIPEKQEETEIEATFKHAILKTAAEKTITESALEIFNGIKARKEMNDIVNGRIRLMLEESLSYGMLKESVENIKRDRARESGQWLLEQVYGDGSTSAILEKMLCADSELHELLKDSDIAERIVKDNWKKLLFEVLHLHYYNREGGKA